MEPKNLDPLKQDTGPKQERFPLNIPESQGDAADQAENQIEADLAEQIDRARRGLSRRRWADRFRQDRDE